MAIQKKKIVKKKKVVLREVIVDHERTIKRLEKSLSGLRIKFAPKAHTIVDLRLEVERLNKLLMSRAEDIVSKDLQICVLEDAVVSLTNSRSGYQDNLRSTQIEKNDLARGCGRLEKEVSNLKTDIYQRDQVIVSLNVEKYSKNGEDK